MVVSLHNHSSRNVLTHIKCAFVYIYMCVCTYCMHMSKSLHQWLLVWGGKAESFIIMAVEYYRCRLVTVKISKSFAVFVVCSYRSPFVCLGFLSGTLINAMMQLVLVQFQNILGNLDAFGKEQSRVSESHSKQWRVSWLHQGWEGASNSCVSVVARGQSPLLALVPNINISQLTAAGDNVKCLYHALLESWYRWPLAIVTGLLAWEKKGTAANKQGNNWRQKTDHKPIIEGFDQWFDGFCPIKTLQLQETAWKDFDQWSAAGRVDAMHGLAPAVLARCLKNMFDIRTRWWTCNKTI